MSHYRYTIDELKEIKKTMTVDEDFEKKFQDFVELFSPVLLTADATQQKNTNETSHQRPATPTCPVVKSTEVEVSRPTPQPTDYFEFLRVEDPTSPYLVCPEVSFQSWAMPWSLDIDTDDVQRHQHRRVHPPRSPSPPRGVPADALRIERPAALRPAPHHTPSILDFESEHYLRTPSPSFATPTLDTDELVCTLHTFPKTAPWAVNAISPPPMRPEVDADDVTGSANDFWGEHETPKSENKEDEEKSYVVITKQQKKHKKKGGKK